MVVRLYVYTSKGMSEADEKAQTLVLPSRGFLPTLLGIPTRTMDDGRHRRRRQGENEEKVFGAEGKRCFPRRLATRDGMSTSLIRKP